MSCFQHSCSTSGSRNAKGLAILPLHLAASHRSVSRLQNLLAAGVDPELRDQRGYTTLHQVIAHWPYILSRRPEPCSKFQSAMRCAEQRAEACLRTLCDHGVDVNAEVDDGGHQTALHLAVRYSALPAVHILAHQGAELDAVDDSGMTALHMASGVLHRDITAALIRLGADVNAVVSRSGNTPLHLATLAAGLRSDRPPGGDISCMAELLERGARCDVTNGAGRTALHEACSRGQEAAAELLLRHGADANQPTAAGKSCLFLLLDNETNVGRADSLLHRLLGLTSPLLLRGPDGLLPRALTLPRFSEQRERLIELSRQPRRLQDMCKAAVYLRHGRGGAREGLRRVLPDGMYRFVFHCWRSAHGVAFQTEMDCVTLVF